MTALPRNGDQRGSDRWDSASRAWVPANEWQRRMWAREDAAFARRANQGSLAAPMVISDSQGGVRGVQSQADGQHYDSKSNMRRHYREAGVIEVGSDVPKTRFIHGNRAPADPHADRKRADAIGRAFNRAGLPTT